MAAARRDEPGTADPEDPFHWSVDKVISEFCAGDHRTAESFRFNEVTGRVLLLTTTYEVLKNELGILPLGKRERIISEVSRLRNRSRGYYLHIQDVASRTPLPADGLERRSERPQAQPAGSGGSSRARPLEEPPSAESPVVLSEIQPIITPATPARLPRKRKRTTYVPPPHLSREILRPSDRCWPNPCYPLSPVGPPDDTVDDSQSTNQRPGNQLEGPPKTPLRLLERSNNGGEPLYISAPFAGLSGDTVGIEPDGEAVPYMTLAATTGDASGSSGLGHQEENAVPVVRRANLTQVYTLDIEEPGDAPNGQAVAPSGAIADAVMEEANPPRIGRAKRRPHYLPRKAHELDSIFYDIGVGEKIEVDEDREFIFTGSVISPGDRRYVARHMKRYLMNTVPFQFQYRGHLRTAIKPYSDVSAQALLRKHQSQSFTVYDVLDNGSVEVRRQSTKSLSIPWPQTPVSKGVQTETEIVRFGVPGLELPLLALNDNSNHDWDYLLKWQNVEGADKIMPLYGDSGSEGEYDKETWAEYQDEFGPKERVKGPSRTRPLSPDQILEALNEGIQETIQKWKFKHLPKLELKAYKIWKNAVKKKTRKRTVVELNTNLNKLKDRLEKLKAEFQKAGIVWTKRDSIKKQCKGNLEPTIYDIQELKWTIQLMKQKTPPERPSTAKVKKVAKSHVVSGDAIEDDEESLGSESEGDYESDDDTGMSDFIVDDEDVEMTGVDNEPDKDIQEQLAREADVEVELAAMEDSDVEDNAPLMQRRRSSKPSEEPSPSKPGQYEDPKKLPTPVPTPPPRIKKEPAPTGGPRPTRARRSPAVIDLTSSPPPETPPPRKRRGKRPSRRSSLERRRSLAGVTMIDLEDEEDNDISKKDQEARRDHTKPQKAADQSAIEKQPEKIQANDSHTIKDKGVVEKEPQAEDQEAALVARKVRSCKLKNRAQLLQLLVSERSDQIRQAIALRLEEIDNDSSGKIMASALASVISLTKQLHRDVPAARGYNEAVYRALAELYSCWQLYLPVTLDFRLTHEQLQKLKDEGTFRAFLRALRVIVDPNYQELAGREKAFKKRKDGSGKNGSGKDGSGKDGSGKDGSGGGKGKSPAESSDEEDDEDAPNSQHRKRARVAVPESASALQARATAARVHKNLLKRIQQRQKKDAERRQRGETVKEPINLGHYERFSDIFFHEHLEENLKPHQVEGIRFMWQQLVADSKTDANGVLLAHTMGLGKTFQVIGLLHAIATASASKNKKIYEQIPESLRRSQTLILCPPGLVENWFDEFYNWIPTKPGSGGKELDLSTIGKLQKAEASTDLEQRLRNIESWNEEGGILIMGYQMFRNLWKNSRNALPEERHKQIRDILLEGPRIVVADEAHHMKNDATQLSMAARGFKTKARIALTGSPLSNNLIEYWNMIEWIHPGYLGNSKGEFKAKYVSPIEDGLFADSSREERRISAKMLRVLKNDLKLKMHRLDISVIKDDLPPKTEFRIKLPLSDLQMQMYTKLIESLDAGTLFDNVHLLSQICTHPWCFVRTLEDRNEKAKGVYSKAKQLGITVEEAETEEENAAEAQEMDAEDQLLVIPEAPQLDMTVAKTSHKWASEMLNAVDDPLSLELSYRTQAFKTIIDCCLELNDRVLVFSHSILTLDFLQRLITKWGIKFQRLDGNTKMSDRQQNTKDFNKGDIMVFLISTEAGGLGLNLFGANRVILFDFKWSPVWEEQAVGRAYRMGQEKHVFVYRFQAAETHEKYMHNKNLIKRQLATKVVEDKHARREAQKAVGKYLVAPRQPVREDLTEFRGKDSVLDRVIADPTYVCGVEYTETFLPDPEDDLTEEDKKEADAILAELRKFREDPDYRRKQDERRRLEGDALRAAEEEERIRAYDLVTRDAREMQQELFRQAGLQDPGQVEATKAMLDSLNRDAQNRPPSTAPQQQEAAGGQASAAMAASQPAVPTNRFGLNISLKRPLPSVFSKGDLQRTRDGEAGGDRAAEQEGDTAGAGA